jgi:hypothetical protein
MAKARGKKSKVSKSSSKLKVTRKSVKKPAKKLERTVKMKAKKSTKKRYMRAGNLAMITQEQQKSINNFIKEYDLTKVSTDPQRGVLVKMGGTMFDISKEARNAGLIVETKEKYVSYYIKPMSQEAKAAAAQEAKPVAAQVVDTAPFAKLEVKESFSQEEIKESKIRRIARMIMPGNPQYGNTTADAAQMPVDIHVNAGIGTGMSVTLPQGFLIERRGTTVNSTIAGVSPEHLVEQVKDTIEQNRRDLMINSNVEVNYNERQQSISIKFVPK